MELNLVCLQIRTMIIFGPCLAVFGAEDETVEAKFIRKTLVSITTMRTLVWIHQVSSKITVAIRVRRSKATNKHNLSYRIKLY